MPLKSILIFVLLVLTTVQASATFFPQEGEGVIYGEEISLTNDLQNQTDFNIVSTLLEDLEPFLELPMRYPTYSHYSADKMTALAMYSRGKAIVLYGPKAAEKLEKPVMGVVIQHEYCHHDLHHRGRSYAAMEAQADCCAAYNLVKINETQAIEKIIDFNEQWGCKYDKSTSLSEVKKDHPCGSQRAYIYNYCATNNVKQLPDEFINQPFPL